MIILTSKLEAYHLMYKLDSKMELWTDDSETQFAIISNSKILSKTNESNFTKKLDASSFNSKDNYDWDSVIRRWIHFYFLTRYGGILLQNSGSVQTKFIPISSYQSRPKLRIKCNYCGLKFHNELDREEHENVWHPKKLKKE